MEIDDQEILNRLVELGVDAQDNPKPGGSYVSVNVRGTIAYIAIQFPIKGSKYFYQGRLGNDLTTSDGYEAAKLSAINVLLQVYHYVGFKRIAGLNHADIYYQSSPSWDEGPILANGASDLFTNILGNRGVHSRAIFGVANLPRNFCTGITTTFTLR